MIKKILKIKYNEYLLNEKVKLFNIDIKNNEIIYDFDFNESEISESEAISLCEYFISEAIK